MKTIFQQLVSKTDYFVQSYKTDFEHDRKGIEKYPNDNFLHIARKYGTSLFILEEDISHYPKKGEEVKYLFGYATREHIIKDFYHTAEYYCKENKDGLFHYFDGKKLIKIDSDKLLQLARDYRDKVLNIWENEDNLKN